MKRKNSDYPRRPIRPLLSLFVGLNMGIILATMIGLALVNTDLAEGPGLTMLTNTAVPTSTIPGRAAAPADSDALAVSLIYHAGDEANLPVEQLNEHCNYTDNTYMLHVHAVGDNFSTSLAETSVHSPDGRYVTFDLNQDVYLQKVGEPALLKLAGNFNLDPKFLTWEPSGDRAFFADRVSATEQALHLFDFRAGLAQAQQTMITITRANRNNFGQWDWIPNQDYLLWQNDNELEIWSVAQRSRVGYHEVRPARIAASFDGSYLAVSSALSQQNYSYTLSLIQTNGRGSHTIPLDYAPGNTLLWSPDNRQVAITGRFSAHQEIIQVYDVRGGNKIAEHLLQDVLFDSLSWASDSQSLTFWEVRPDEEYFLYRWQFAADTFQLLEDADRRPESDPAESLTALSTHYIGADFALFQPINRQHTVLFDNGKLYLSQQDGSDPLVLATDVHTIEAQSWSADGSSLAVAWTQNNTSSRTVITWTDTQTAQTAHISTGNFSRLDWKADGRYLVVEHKTANNQKLVLINAANGHTASLGNGFSEIYRPGFYHPEAFYAFHWRDNMGNYGYDGYNEDGTRAFRVNYTNPRPWAIEKVFFAPNGQWAALKTYAPGTDLYLARTDGAPNDVVRTDMPGLGDPFWSPDSRLIAFTEWDGHQQTVSIVNVAGDTRWQTPFPYDIRAVYMTWEPCEGN